MAEEKLFCDLVEICSKLRGKGGCMWDREQTHKSLIRHLKEESGEVIDAIEKDDKDNLKEELGDLLYQVIFHSEIASEAGDFNIWDVVTTLKEKLIRRHPHIFGAVNVSSVDDIIKNWENIKKQEKKDRGI